MVTTSKRVFLIEANSNPTLETAQDPIMQRIIPRMLDSAFRLALDPVLPPADMNFRKCSGHQRNLF